MQGVSLRVALAPKILVQEIEGSKCDSGTEISSKTFKFSDSYPNALLDRK